MIPMANVSRSMYGVPMEVSIALPIGLSEITHEAYRNMILTFSSEPSWHRLNDGDSIVGKVRSLSQATWGSSTNFEKAYDLVLATTKASMLPREDVPVLVVFSDMQFDEALDCSTTRTTMFEHIQTKFFKVGPFLGWMDTKPTPIVFWNLRNTGGHPVGRNTEGAVILAGFSPSLLKFILNSEAFNEEEYEMVEPDGTL